MTMINPDAHVPLGDVFDYEGDPVTVRRDFDLLTVPQISVSPAGVRQLEQRIGTYWNELARYRLRVLDLGAHGVDVPECRRELASLPGIGDPADLAGIDWNEVGRRLEKLRPYGGFADLRKLHALLVADETPAGATL